jgi:cytochrome P450
MAFGAGPHFCIGGPLGRLEGIVAINAILRRLPNLRLATSKLEWRTSLSFRGVRALPVTF